MPSTDVGRPGRAAASVTLLAFLCVVSILPVSAQTSAVQAPAVQTPALTPAAAAPSATPPAIPAPSPAVAKPQRILIVLDPAHGGGDSGARLGDNALEKDIVLAFSFRLRSLLSARGFTVVVTRDADAETPPTPDQRAEFANHANALACILIHATASGNGVHLFNSSLASASARRNAFLPWDTAQSAYLDRSLRLSAELHSAFDRAKIPVTMGRTFLRPLDNLTCPAVAIEIAPFAAADGQDAAEVSDPAYQQRVSEAIAWAMLQWRARSTGLDSGSGSEPSAPQTGGQP